MRYTDRILGIDPAEQIAHAATQSGIPTLAEFFDGALAREIAQRNGKADIIISNNTVANIDDLDSFFTGIKQLLADDGLLIIETQYGLDVLTKTLLDVIYHEHISYFAVHPFRGFLQRCGLALVGAERIAPKGGSIRFKIQRAGGSRPVDRAVNVLVDLEVQQGLYDGRLFDDFNHHITELRERIRSHLTEPRHASVKCFAYGASVGCVALIHYFDLCDIIEVIFDDNPLIDTLRTARGTIPVRPGRLLAEEEPTDVIVLAWRYANVIATGQAEFRRKGGRFFAVLPDLTEADGNNLTPPMA
jgi:hypothetical protein